MGSYSLDDIGVLLVRVLLLQIALSIEHHQICILLLDVLHNRIYNEDSSRLLFAGCHKKLITVFLRDELTAARDELQFDNYHQIAVQNIKYLQGLVD